MPDYGITDKGFVLKRMDKILEEIHSDLTEGYGFDTRITRPSFLDVLVTTFAGQIANLWEVAQDSYYAKYPATATGLNLDNAVQYGGISRAAARKSVYPLHCTGDDGTKVRAGATVATNTKPEKKLSAVSEFRITREKFNMVDIIVAAPMEGLYTVSINGDQYSYTSESIEIGTIIKGLKDAIKNEQYTAEVIDTTTLRIKDTMSDRSNVLTLSDNLTTSSVTTIAQFATEEYGKVVLPNGIVTKMVNNIPGFTSVTNMLEPKYGRKVETDIELRQSYIAKSALRSNTMIESIVSELMNNVANIESASGFENYTDETDERGLPPHSIEIVVEGGDNQEIAQAILRRKAGGIQTFGSITVEVPGSYGDIIPIHFNRPDYLYTWLKITLHGDSARIPSNYDQLTKQAIMDYASGFRAGTDLLIQQLTEGIYDSVAGVTYIDIKEAHFTDKGHSAIESEYKHDNIIVTTRQKILFGETRIEVTLDADD